MMLEERLLLELDSYYLGEYRNYFFFFPLSSRPLMTSSTTVLSNNSLCFSFTSEEILTKEVREKKEVKESGS